MKMFRESLCGHLLPSQSSKSLRRYRSTTTKCKIQFHLTLCIVSSSETGNFPRKQYRSAFLFLKWNSTLREFSLPEGLQCGLKKQVSQTQSHTKVRALTTLEEYFFREESLVPEAVPRIVVEVLQNVRRFFHF